MGRPIVMVPYTRVDYLDQIMQVLNRWNGAYSVQRVHNNRPEMYGELLTAWWAWAGDLIVCEHDVVPTLEQVEELASCHHEWCGFPYIHGEKLAVRCLGFTKFSEAFRRRLPGVMEGAAWIHDDRARPTPWWSIDARLALHLSARGEVWHQHRGLVAHRPALHPS